jgi:hypothetical protein
MIKLDIRAARASQTSRNCQQVYKYERRSYVRGNAIIISSEWRRVARHSCRGCDFCTGYGPMEDCREIGAEHLDIRCKDLRHGTLYRATNVVDSRDYETGNVEDWHWEMIPWTPPGG